MTDKTGSFAPKKLFRELRMEIGKILFLKAFLDSAILFFALNIILTLFNISFVYSLIPAILFLAYQTYRGFRKKTVRKLEEGNPEIHEILRTAYDNRNVNTLMAQGMMFDLQKNLATVSTGVLLDPKNVITKVVLIALLAFTPVVIISFAPQLIQANPFQDFDFFGFFDKGKDGVAGLFDSDLQQTSQFGNADIIELGNERLEINVKKGGGTVDFQSIEDPQDLNFGYNDYPEEVAIQAAEASSGNSYSNLETELIKDYSCRAKGTC